MTELGRCPLCKRRYSRSKQQNATYWLLLHTMAEKLRPGGKQFGAEAYHVYFKSKFLGSREVALPNGKTLLIPNSTASLDVSEFSDYYGKVEADAALRGVYLDMAEVT